MAFYTITDDDQSVTASAFNDNIHVSGDRDTIMAGEGADVVNVEGFNDVIHGEAGTDQLHDLEAGHSNLLDGGADDDVLYGCVTDTLIGGDGTDTFVLTVNGLASGVTADFTALGSGTEDLVFSWGELVDLEGGTFGGTAHDDTLRGSGSVDMTLFGDDGNDVILGMGGQTTPHNGPEVLIGGAGDDQLVAGAGPAQLYAFDNGGAVELKLGVGQAVDVGADHDTLRGGDFNDSLFAGYGFETLIGGGGTDTVDFQYLTHASVNLRLDKGHGTNSDGGRYAIKSVETVFGTQLNDKFIGGVGNEFLNGGDGDDTLSGGLGADQLNGGPGHDTFIYRSVAESSAAAPDIIGFNDNLGAEVIDLHTIDAKANKDGNQKFTLVDQFTGHSGELVANYDIRGDVTTVKGDVDGDGVADLMIVVHGVVGEFVL